MSGALHPIDRMVLESAAVAEAADRLLAGRAAGEVRVGRAAWAVVLAAMVRRAGHPLLVVPARDEEARDLSADLAALLGDDRVALWPSRGAMAGGTVGISPHITGQRARAVGLLGATGQVVVASVPALAERVPVASARRGAVRVAVGDRLDLDAFVDRLGAMGYERVPQVEERGEMAVRGGLVDVYPSTADGPVRIDWFGDEVEQIRAFSPFTQKTIRPLRAVEAWAAAEDPGAALADALDDPGPGAARIVRLGPADYGRAMRDALERFEDEAAAGALADSDRTLQHLAGAAALDLVVPAGADDAAFDAVEARFPTRGMAEAQGAVGRDKLPQKCRGRHPHLEIYETGCDARPAVIMMGASNLWFASTQSIIVMPRTEAEESFEHIARSDLLEIGERLRPPGDVGTVGTGVAGVAVATLPRGVTGEFERRKAGRFADGGRGNLVD